MRSALQQPLNAIVDTVRRTLESTPPELASDVSNRGIVLAGGGALLRGIDQLLGTATGLPITVAETPLECVVRGAGASLEESAALTGPTTKRSRRIRRKRRHH